MYQVELGVGEIGKIRKIAGCGKLLKDVILEAVGCENNHGDFCRLRPCLQRIVIDFQSRGSSHSCHSQLMGLSKSTLLMIILGGPSIPRFC